MFYIRVIRKGYDTSTCDLTSSLVCFVNGRQRRRTSRYLTVEFSEIFLLVFTYVNTVIILIGISSHDSVHTYTFVLIIDLIISTWNSCKRFDSVHCTIIIGPVTWFVISESMCLDTSKKPFSDLGKHFVEVCHRYFLNCVERYFFYIFFQIYKKHTHVNGII
ncbi:hypothetical protein [Salmon gill poxvirus]|nr:hypothetical protein [Salmon gill poxvirus]